MIKQVLTFSILTGFLLTSCNNNQNNQNETNATQKETTDNEELILGSWGEPNPINEKEIQGIEILKEGNAKSINMATLVLSKWWTKNNQLFLVQESIGNGTSGIDTAAFEIIKLDKDSLILKDRYVTIRYKKQ